MSQKQRVLAALVALSLLFLYATLWAGSDPADMKCLPEQPSYDSPGVDYFSPNVGVHRNQVLVEIAVGTW